MCPRAWRTGTRTSRRAEPSSSSLHRGRALETEARHLFELFGEVQQVVLLAELSHELNSDGQPVVQARGDRDRRRARERDRQDELHVARPLVAEKRRHLLYWHGQETERGREQEVEARLQRDGHGTIRRVRRQL